MTSPLVVFERIPHVVLREADDWGIRVLDLAALRLPSLLP